MTTVITAENRYVAQNNNQAGFILEYHFCELSKVKITFHGCNCSTIFRGNDKRNHIE